MNGEDSDVIPYMLARYKYLDSNQRAKNAALHNHLEASYSNRNFSSCHTADKQDDFDAAASNVNGSDSVFYTSQSDSVPAVHAVGLLFPVQESDSDVPTWNMPGAFHTGDAMDLDHLPPFTVALDIYFDANTPTMYEDGANRGIFAATHSQRAQDHNISRNGLSPDMLETKPSSVLLREGQDSVETNQYNFQMAVPAGDQTQHSETVPDFTPQELPQSFSLEFQGLPGSDIQGYTGEMCQDHDLGFQSLPFVNTPDEDNKQKVWPRREYLCDRLSVLGPGADLLPLTTTTSLTPSVSSLHLTQPSFFSANQFFRSSFDQPPSLVHRASIDVYNRQRLSIDSQNSGANPPTRNPRSLASYFPFMGDRDRKLPGSPVAADWPQQNQQLRHLIRSIFKTNADSNPTEDDLRAFEDGMFPEELYDEDVLGDVGDDSPLKKVKRPRRGLFTRFKTTKTSEIEMKQEPNSQDVPRPDTLNSELIKHETSSSVASRESASLQNSAHNSMQGSNPNSLQHLSSANLSQMETAEPDYGALFHGVGKRRNLVGMKNKKSKTETGVKIEPRDGEVASNNEKLSLSFPRSSQDYHSGDSKLSQSGQLSQTSSTSVDGFNQEETPSTFASASKRILGSRLLKRKASTRVMEPRSHVVEIDLTSLDLPPNTEILSEVNPQTRTRGRKEDKAADMEDQSKIYVCGYCTRRFKRQEHLKRHFRSLHTSEKPYECSICQKKFSRTDNLNQHLKVHKQEEEAALAVNSAATLGKT